MRIFSHLAAVLAALAVYMAAPQTIQAASWLTNSSMNAMRWNHSATLLPNGNVLVAGGYDGSGYYATSSAALYFPATTTWTNTGSMPFSRGHQTATLLPNGQVLATGGFDIRPPSGIAESNVMLYFPATGTWLETNRLSTRRAFHTATMLSNGKVLVVGGFGQGNYPTNTELFNPATGTWSLTGSLAIGRAEHTATLLANGKVLIAGGHGSSSPFNTAQVYDPATGIWTATGPLSVARQNHTATLLPNGKVLVTGGFGGGASAELYDPIAGIWSVTSSMANQRLRHTATLLPNGRVLVAGGQTLTGTVLSSAELYDPISGNWSNGGVMSTNRQNHTATLLADGEVLVTGGNTATPTYPTGTELYVPDGLSASAIFLDSAASLGTGFRFTFTNIPIPGATFTVYSTTNPALPIGDWSILGGANDLSPGQFDFIDAQANNFEMRFYRVIGP